ncbi:EF-P beta-lysylation protein EpmB [Fuerstiella marisgermanici]|uniref:L-lysine 2,3-aminomutase n=1 Tax=Fuerstiella marisgermanici TaxID=1891926 RepID=A0A1P8WEZ8_9PLAN|nr:EF-P beta-lysylation protein EpmB [Fuerstiella marisgermanici]APZ92646.1 L-lysine 2,3-aminomutase [Fuerstiella marisgermanici]
MSTVPAANPVISGLSRAQSGEAAGEPESWQRQLAAAIRDPAVLLKTLDLPADTVSTPLVPVEGGQPAFPLLVPLSFVNRMQPGNRNDPLLKQVLPLAEEQEAVPDFVADPVGDSAAKVAPGLLQKYHGRALLVTTGACAVHCRYCFRREYPYHDEPRRMSDWQPALNAIADDNSVTEVILSGGDPLILNDGRLAELFGHIDAIPHVERIRIHTRLPIVLPARVTPELLKLLNGLRSQPVFVVHANHGHEIADDCRDALRQLVSSGIPTLNQAVLLKGINDSADVLEDLCRRLINIGVMPYYLHQLDKVIGAAHFEVPVAVGLGLIDELGRRLPGYAVPKFVQEIAGETGKTPLITL